MSEDSVVLNQKVVLLSNCQSGIGIKIVGGTSSNGRSNYGIFVKKTIPGSPAEREGCLREGDKILKVNNESVQEASNARAMSVLVNAAKAGIVTFLIERSDTSDREYADLLGTLNNGAYSPNKYGSSSPQELQRTSISSPTAFQKRSWVLADGRMSPLSPGLLSPSNFGTSGGKPVINPKKEANLVGRTSNHGNCLTNGERPTSLAESNGDSGLQSSSSTLNNMSNLTVAHISLRNGLGLSITGGSNHSDGPNVTVKELIDGGDVQCDGKIKQGDQIVSINDVSFLNITHEEAKVKLTQLKLRTEEEFEITYIAQGQFSLEQGERGIGKENAAINLSTIATSSVKESSTLSEPELIKTGLGSQTLRAQHFDENGNYSSKKILHPNNFTANEHFSSIMQAPIQPSSIPFYLQKDLALSSELSSTRTSLSASQNFENADRPSRVKKSPKRRLSLAPSSKLRVEKLEVALSYLGIQLTPQQQEGIRGKLHVDTAGLVSYGEFVNVAQEVLSVELQDRSQALNQGKLMFALHNNIEKNDLVLDYPIPKTSDAALEDLKRQRDNALDESRRLGEMLDKKESSKIAREEQLESIRRTAKEALEESMSLKNQVSFATQAKMVADKQEEEYEEVIRLLEDELRLVKSKGTPKQQEFQDLQKKIIVLGCQLRKMEVIKRTYEVATKRLLGFAEHVHDCLKTGTRSSSTLHNSNPPQDESDASNKNVQQTPGYLSHRHTSQTLADEARDLVHGVRVLLEEEPLPFGWEEAYTSEGERYFINHVTQITSWLHPVTHTIKEKTKDV